jgi:hypothetical protein
MPTPASIYPTNEDQKINLRLWLGITFPPIAGGLNTLVGYMVSNYDCNVHNRRLVFLVNLLSALICILAGLSSFSTRRKIKGGSDDASESMLHTRRFMMYAGLCLSAGFLLFICAGTTSTFLLGACDL